MEVHGEPEAHSFLTSALVKTSFRYLEKLSLFYGRILWEKVRVLNAEVVDT
jgi:hypothetical protein